MLGGDPEGGKGGEHAGALKYEGNEVNELNEGYSGSDGENNYTNDYAKATGETAAKKAAVAKEGARIKYTRF